MDTKNLASPHPPHYVDPMDFQRAVTSAPPPVTGYVQTHFAPYTHVNSSARSTPPESTPTSTLQESIDDLASAIAMLKGVLASQPRVCPSTWEETSRMVHTCQDCGKVLDLSDWNDSVVLAMLPLLYTTQHYRFD